MKKSWRRWLPAALIPAIVVAAAVAVPAAADAAPKLPTKSAQQVLELIAGSASVTYSGTIDQSSNLGLPQLPAAGHGPATSASTAIEILTASHTARVYVGGPDASRMQVMDTLAERDVVRNGADVWLYSSRVNEATHITLPPKATHAGAAASAPVTTPGAAKTPAEMARMMLANVDSSTSVTVGDNARVAGRPVYTLTLTPKSTATLVGSVALSVDSETGLPLSVVVVARGQTNPAFSIAFSSIDFAAPAASLFTFTPPPGAKITETRLPVADGVHAKSAGNADAARPTVIGAGWDAIVALPAMAGVVAPDASAPDASGPGASGLGASGGAAPDATGGVAPDTSMSALLDTVLTPVAGGRVLQTALVSVFLASDGRVFVGAVPAERLQAAAAAR